MNPYISVVITGRNDNYGENFLDRLNIFIKSLDHQVIDFPDLIELIIVEWNPPVDTPPLMDVIIQPKNLNCRIITVSNQIHETLNSKSPMLEFYAKNVGIRRANGKFVLVTNPDILFTNELITYFSTKHLDENSVHRVDRYDYKGNEIKDVAVEDYINYAASNTFLAHICYNENNISVPVNPKEHFPVSVIKPYSLHLNACGDFILATKENFLRVGGLWETLSQKWHLDSYSLLKFAGNKIGMNVLLFPYCIFHMDHYRKEPDVKYNPSFSDKIINNPNILLSDAGEDWGLNNIELTEYVNERTIF